MDRRLSLISEKTGKLLTIQIAHELKNFNLYRSFANYYGLQGFQDLETYFNKRADEEKNHADWISEYLSNGDYRLEFLPVEVNKEQKVNNFIDPFNNTVEREIETTEMIYGIYRQCLTEGDYMTCSWLLNGLIKEQIEEENTSRMARDIMEQEADVFVKAEKVLDLLEK